MFRKFLQRDEVPEPRERPPAVSVVVIVYDMADQAERTVRSLFTDYQVGVCAADYEVIVVENASRNLLDGGFVGTLPENFRYFLRTDAEPSPAAAINFGARQARGEHICIMIDGARMLTPGVMRSLLLGHRLSPRAVVAVPGYHLGTELQQEAVNSGYNTEQELRLLEGIGWPLDGYQLFDIACFSGSSAPGFFLPNSESNCISVSRGLWRELDGFDERFDFKGGGLINLDFYKRACEAYGVLHVMCIGEGTFHQFHGGVTTGGQAAELREAYINASKEQYRLLRGREFESPRTDPVYLGEMPRNVLPFLQQSMNNVKSHALCSPARMRAVDGR